MRRFKDSFGIYEGVTVPLEQPMIEFEEDSDPDFINDEEEEDDESSSSSSSDDEYWDEINEAESVEDGMKILLKRDPETFYCYGERVKEMLKYKLQNNW